MNDSKEQTVKYYSDEPKPKRKPKLQESQKAKLIWETKTKLGLVASGSEDLSIYRLPNKLRKVKAEAYNPRIVSIGPLHRGNPDLVAMGEHKWRYMLQFLQRTKPIEHAHKSLEDCTDALYVSDDEVRRCYAEKIEFEINDLTKVMLLDGCFILELFLRYDQHSLNKKLKGKLDPIFNNAWMIPALRQDLALLENQIPFFILEKLYCIIKPHLDDNNESLISLALNFFQPMNHKASREHRDTELQDSDHLLDLLHKFYFLPSLESPRVTNNHNNPVRNGAGDGQLSINLTIQLAPNTQNISTVQTISHLLPISTPRVTVPPPSSASILRMAFSHGASQLLESGIQFEKGSTEDHLLNITFSKGVVKIPPIIVDQTTDSLFRNLIAFEQCHLKSSHQITSYAILMKSLIRSKEDIKLLKSREIIQQNLIGTQHLIGFGNMLQHVHAKDFCFGELCKEVNEYSKSWLHWRKHKVFWMVRFRRHLRSLYGTHFSSPWSMIAFFAAVVIFGLTATQTYYAIHPR